MNPHILLGAAVPFLLGTIVYIGRRFRASFGMLILTPLFAALGAAWAVAPDFPRVFGFHQFYNQIHTDPRINMFLWHYDIDRVEVESRWYGVVFVLLFACLIAAAWRELHLREKED